MSHGLGAQPNPNVVGLPGQAVYRPAPPRASIQNPNIPRGQGNLPQNAASRMPMNPMMRMAGAPPPGQPQAMNMAQMHPAAAQQVISLAITQFQIQFYYSYGVFRRPLLQCSHSLNGK